MKQPSLAKANEETIAVMDFTNVTGDPDSAWLAAGIAETVTGDLRAPDLIVRSAGSRETPTLEAYRAFTEGWLLLETLDIREIPHANRNFERAIRVDPRYALAYTGLASAELAAYEDIRSESAPTQELIARSFSSLAFASVRLKVVARPSPSACPLLDYGGRPCWPNSPCG